jgi:hypothetical protein
MRMSADRGIAKVPKYQRSKIVESEQATRLPLYGSLNYVNLQHKVLPAYSHALPIHAKSRHEWGPERACSLDGRQDDESQKPHDTGRFGYFLARYSPAIPNVYGVQLASLKPMASMRASICWGAGNFWTEAGRYS